jgi:hypothetical protein
MRKVPVFTTNKTFSFYHFLFGHYCTPLITSLVSLSCSLLGKAWIEITYSRRISQKTRRNGLCCYPFVIYLTCLIASIILRYRLVSFIPGSTPPDWQWGAVKNETLRQKKDNFNFPIVNFPFICSNIPAAPAYGVYISQMIRYSRACGSYQDFHDRGLLTRKLLN